VGGVGWHQYFGDKMDNGKLAGKIGSVRINKNNIFHTLLLRIIDLKCIVCELKK
jgi:hypothetical protein